MTTLMIQGTATDVGKSILVAGLGRLLVRRGWRVVPFKPQNMALNSAVTADGGEIGRAQAVQAEACGLEPHVDMNPVLLKPNTDTGAQVIIHGKPIGNQEAREYHDYKKVAMDAVLESHRRLSDAYELVLVEGAGSPAEVNLREGDIANMGFAEAVDCPVLLVGDIDKGGVFAQLMGTLMLLSDSERNRIAGLIINKFRGDISLLDSGLEWLEQQSGKPVLGVVPWLHGLHIEAEDAVDTRQEMETAGLRVVVPVLPHISNHTDFDPLRMHPQVDLHYVAIGDEPPGADLIILPGSKNVRSDLAHLLEHGWQQRLQQHLRYGGKVLGICGGFQMLGETIHDPQGIEHHPGSDSGLGLLPVKTVLATEKNLKQVTGRLCLDNARVQGYEIHHGETTVHGMGKPLTDIGEGDGLLSEDGLVAGSYLHGIFDHPEALQALLKWAGLHESVSFDYQKQKEQNLDRLADALEQHLDIERIEEMIR